MSPAFNIDLSSVIFSSEISSEPGYKLTIADAGLGITPGTITRDGTTITVPYTITGTNADKATQVSVLITKSPYSAGTAVDDENEYKYLKLNVSNFATSGTGTFTLPDGYDYDKWGTDYHVYILAEDVNGTYDTDYASVPVSIAVSDAPRYNITCSDDGHGSATATPTSGTAGTTVEIKATPDSGYRFKEWQVQSGNITLADARSSKTTFSMGNCDVRIKAIFEEVTGGSHYTVTFDSNGHGKAPSSQTVESGAKATEPEDPEEEGYIFRGWYKEAECENRYNFNTEVTGDITLYAKWRKDESEDDDHDHDDSSSTNTNTANPGVLSSYYVASPYNATVIKQAQGNLARLAFNAGMPAGYKEAFTYNMLVNGKADHSLKSGKFVLTIPAEYQKAGRKFALLGLDRTGKVLCITDTDLSDSTLTTTLLIDGYAFMLVYSDGGVSAVKTTSATAGNTVQSSGTYKIKKGDTLSGIAKKLDTTVAKLMRNNNIKEKDKIREGQILKY